MIDLEPIVPFRYAAIFAIFIFVVGALLSIDQCIIGNYIEAVIFFINAIIASLSIICYNQKISTNGVLGGAFFILTVVSVTTFLLKSPLTNSDIQSAIPELEELFVKFSLDTMDSTQEENEIAKAGVGACMFQSTIDEMKLTNAMIESKLGPISTLLFSLFQRKSPSEEPKQCLDFYYDLHKARPEYFSSFDISHPVLARIATAIARKS
ncbi:MAG: hypothetical protein PW843_08855 [Azospirillaceae bacterium]|nr:hypothetical protein [Azospirillaceae bacterium]